jgi:hypothetical protein
MNIYHVLLFLNIEYIYIYKFRLSPPLQNPMQTHPKSLFESLEWSREQVGTCYVYSLSHNASIYLYLNQSYINFMFIVSVS